MLSLDNVFDGAQLESWLERTPADTYLTELKIDGASINLLYVNGELELALTRGDGTTGEDITHNAKTLDDIPQKLKGTEEFPVPELVEVRGEVFITVEDFATMNAQRQAEGLKMFANPRNAAAGAMRQKCRRHSEATAAPDLPRYWRTRRFHSAIAARGIPSNCGMGTASKPIYETGAFGERSCRAGDVLG